jgi:hypothetical protein
VRICCIQDLFLRYVQRRQERWLGDVRPLENLRGDLERQERLPSWFAEVDVKKVQRKEIHSCNLKGYSTDRIVVGAPRSRVWYTLTVAPF